LEKQFHKVKVDKLTPSRHQFSFHCLLQTFGIVCTLIAERLLDTLEDDRVANGILAGVLLVGACITALIKPDYRYGHFNLYPVDPVSFIIAKICRTRVQKRPDLSAACVQSLISTISYPGVKSGYVKLTMLTKNFLNCWLYQSKESVVGSKRVTRLIKALMAPVCL
jgi:hypothetical protein